MRWNQSGSRSFDCAQDDAKFGQTQIVDCVALSSDCAQDDTTRIGAWHVREPRPARAAST